MKHIAILLCLVMIPIAVWAKDIQPALSPTPTTESLPIITAEGKTVTLNVEIATTKEERIKGLMGRDSLANDAGMLFLLGEVIEAKFWMKNTKIPLDLIFIGEDGVVRGVYENARPFDLTPIPAPEPVSAVLEINGKTSKTLGIIRGSKVIHKAFKKDLK